MKKLTIASSIAAAFLTACGGGGGFDPTPEPGSSNALRMTPLITDVGIYAGYTYKIARFTSGVKPYYVLSSSSTVTGELDSDNYLHLHGNYAASEEDDAAVVSVQDSSLGQSSLSMTVKVYGLQLTSTAGTSASLVPGQVFETTIRGGTAPYRVVSSDPSVASANIDSNGNLQILAGNPSSKPAEAEITVVDSVGNAVVIDIVVNESVLTLSPSSTVGVQGGQTSFQIFGGTGPYRVTSANPLIARPTISGNEVNVEFVGPGTTTLTVTDAYGTSQTFSVEVRRPVVVVSPASQTIDESNNSVLRFGLSAGTGPYTAALLRADQALFSATIVESERLVTPAVYDGAGNLVTPAVYETVYTLELGLGTQGNRCVTENREVEVLITDSAGNVSRLPITVRNTGAC